MKMTFQHQRFQKTILGFVTSVFLIIFITNYSYVEIHNKEIFWLLLQSTLILSSAFFWLRYGIKHILKSTSALHKINRKKEDKIANLKVEIEFFKQKFKRQTEQLNQKQSEVNQTQIFTNISLHIRQHLNQKDIFRTTVEEIQDLLSVERVAICCFNTDCSGTVLREITEKNYPEIASEQIDDLCFSRQRWRQYKNGYVSAINDIYSSELSECYVNFLEKMGVRATLVAPIIQGKHLFGLLIAHKCEKPRVWLKWEMNLVKHLAIQVGVALSVAEKFEQSEKVRLNAEYLVKEQCKQNEILQQKLTTILSKGENNDTYCLADVEVKQAQKIRSALSAFSRINFSTQAVVDSIQQATIMSLDILVTAETGVTTMEETFESILNLRSTVVEAGYKVKRFGDKTQGILKAASSINQFALQTNVIALNSGFGANTGENGRGLNIVAGKVGRLATQSSEASEEIKQIVESIQIENREVMEAVDKGMAQVAEEAELINITKSNLAQIIEISRQLHELVQSIFSTTLSQVETFQSVMNEFDETFPRKMRQADVGVPALRELTSMGNDESHTLK